jgi:hypothetical protein
VYAIHEAVRRTLPGVQVSKRCLAGTDIQCLKVFDRLLLLRKGGETVYFGDLGRNATTLIDYFEGNGSRKCHPTENPYVT